MDVHHIPAAAATEVELHSLDAGHSRLRVEEHSRYTAAEVEAHHTATVGVGKCSPLRHSRQHNLRVELAVAAPSGHTLHRHTPAVHRAEEAKRTSTVSAMWPPSRLTWARTKVGIAAVAEAVHRQKGHVAVARHTRLCCNPNLRRTKRRREQHVAAVAGVATAVPRRSASPRMRRWRTSTRKGRASDLLQVVIAGTTQADWRTSLPLHLRLVVAAAEDPETAGHPTHCLHKHCRSSSACAAQVAAAAAALHLPLHLHQVHSAQPSNSSGLRHPHHDPTPSPPTPAPRPTCAFRPSSRQQTC